ncbi:hypothetical protein [Aurantibacillus circumpalustris]|uniref:hypothetical protein n=1 Tax=Aurantibacillus circumpalustris TaxID=3036359 RepID=UPI00295B5EE6|nr:hypothetical protein [Aurantibacillus circumpalustris]
MIFKEKFSLKIISATILVFVLFMLNSCMCFCNCKSCSGCKIVTSFYVGNDSIIERKVFCSLGNLLVDQSVEDSVTAFGNKYSGQSNMITVIDSTFDCITKTKLTCNEAKKLKTFMCVCAK